MTQPPHVRPEPIERQSAGSGAPWEALVGYARVVRAGPHVFVTGTTATMPGGGHPEVDDAYGQARVALANIARALGRVGADLLDVVRTRIFVTHIERDWSEVGRAHAELLGHVRPATSMVEVRKLIAPWMCVEIEADAVIGARPMPSRVGPDVIVEYADAHARAEALALLERSELPLPPRDPSHPPTHFLVARRGPTIVGCVGFEPYPPYAFLRSAVVAHEARRSGVGNALVVDLTARLKELGYESVVCLTVAARHFFERHKFEAIPATDIPEPVRTSDQFEIDPAHAVAMRRVL